MSTQERKTGLPQFFTDTGSAETIRRQFIETPLDAASQSALGSSLELATFMSILPGAFVASQQRELKRVLQTGSDNDPRVTALQASIAEAEILQTMTRRGQARVERTLVALAAKDEVFHGFVSDADFSPLPGLTVRLNDGKASRTSALSATTDADGYFSIQVGTKTNAKQDSTAPPMPSNVAQRITDLLASLSQTNAAAPTPANPAAAVSQVEVLKKGKLLYSDPAPVTLDGGSIYREYVIADTAPPSASDFRDFVAQQTLSSPGVSLDPTESATAKTQASAEVANSSTTPAGPPRTKKKATRAAKSTKSGSKK